MNIKKIVFFLSLVFYFFGVNTQVFAAPTFESLTHNGNKVNIYYDENIVSPLPAGSDFTVKVNSTTESVSSVSTASSLGTKVVQLTITSVTTANDVVTVTYTPGANPIASGTGNASSFSNRRAFFAIKLDSGSNNKALFVDNFMYIESVSPQGKFSIINTDTDTYVKSILIPSSPQILSMTAVGRKIYVVTSNNKVSVYNITTDTLSTPITTTGCNTSVGDNNSRGDVAVVGTNIYYPCGTSLKVIDTTTDTISNTISMGTTVKRPTIVGKKVYWINSQFLGNNVKVLNTETNSVTTISVGTTPISSNYSNEKLYVINFGSNSLSIINTTTDTVTSTISTNLSGPEYSAIFNNKLYVGNIASLNNGTIAIFNTVTDTFIQAISTSGAPYTPVIASEKLFTVSVFENLIYITDGFTNASLTSIPYARVEGYYINVTGDTLYIPAYGGVLYVVKTNTIPSQVPVLTSFSTTSASGTYTTGQSIPIRANFNTTLSVGSTMTVLLNSGSSVVLDQISGKTLSGTYTVQSGDTTPDLAIKSITSANVTDGTSIRTSYDIPSSKGTLVAENSYIARNLGDSVNIKIGQYFSFPTGSRPYQISPAVNGVVYVANQGSNNVSVIDLSTVSYVGTISVGTEPYGLSTATVSGTTYVYVANIGTDNVSVINTTTNTVVATVAVGAKPYYVATIGTNVYVTNAGTNNVSVIDATNNTVTATIPVGNYPRGIKAYGTDLYVANYGDQNYSGGNTISVIDSNTNTVTDTIFLPGNSDGPRGINVLDDKVYVTNFRTNDVSVIDTATNAITARIAVGKGPRGLVGYDGYLYVENFDDSSISIINTATNTVSSTIAVGSSPSGITRVGTDILITSFQDNRLYILDSTTRTLRSGFNGISDDSPSQPTSFSGTPGNSQVSLLWTAPSDIGGSAIIDYVVEYKLPSDISWTTYDDGVSSSTSALVTGLLNDNVYSFRVYAVNGSSTGDASDSLTVSLVLPQQPTSLAGTPGNLQVALSWSAPSDTGGSAIVDYVVQYKISTDVSWTTFADGTSTSTSIAVTGLLNSTVYNFRVYAVNSSGTGIVSSTATIFNEIGIYYFDNSLSNTDENDLSNYWRDEAKVYPAITLPDFESDRVSILENAEFTRDITLRSTAYNKGIINGNVIMTDSGYNDALGVINGDVIMRDSGSNGGEINGDVSMTDFAYNSSTINGNIILESSTFNDGPVSGNANFIGDQPDYTLGTIAGTKTRTFRIDANTGFDFTSDGGWIVVADGAVVEVTSATYDGTTSFVILNNGSFIPSNIPITQTVPSVPRTVSATAGDGRASVSFVEPSNLGGSAVTTYTVTSSPGSIVATGATSPIVVTGLTNGVAYTFVVTATNSTGTGSASDATSAVTPSAASQPSKTYGYSTSNSNTRYTVTKPIPVIPVVVDNKNNTTPVFTKSLTLRINDKEVKSLQEFLNKRGFVIATSGPGSKGNETTFFGAKTRQALSLFQKKYMITPSIGYFGPITREKVNSMIKAGL